MSKQKVEKGLATPCSKRQTSQKFTSFEKDSMPTSLKFASPSRRLTQEELVAWWPFQRLNPKKFPKPVTPTYEDALL